jgi:HSP20 family protein
VNTVARHSPSPVADMLDWLESGPALGLRGFGLAPYVRIEDYMDEGTYVLRAEMPGIDPDKDVSLDIEGDMLTFSGERQEEQKDKNRHEFHYGSFTRSIPLPHGVKTDEITATYVDGVLEVRVPSVVVERKPVKVSVGRRGSEPKDSGPEASEPKESERTDG